MQVNDKVVYKKGTAQEDVGIIVACVDNSSRVWVKWESTNSVLSCAVKDLQLAESSEIVKMLNEVADYSGTVVEYKGRKYRLVLY